MEEGLGKNMSERCSTSITSSLQATQSDMIGKTRPAPLCPQFSQLDEVPDPNSDFVGAGCRAGIYTCEELRVPDRVPVVWLHL